MSLKKYKSKRNFKKTTEPPAKKSDSGKDLIFVVQKHHARRLHYDFRLEWQGALKSWAVPKGPSLNPKDKRLAVEVEDHPVDYAHFEGNIPKGEYGAGQVIVWDYGKWKAIKDFKSGLRKGHIEFELTGEKLKGKWSLIRMPDEEPKKHNWLLIKHQDEEAKTDYDITEEEPESVLNKTKGKNEEKTTKTKKKNQKKPPEFIKPQLATLTKVPPEGEEWIHEIKYDGYRTLCRIHNEDVRWITRSGQNWTKKYSALNKDIQKISSCNALLDGEICWIDDRGHSRFQELQNALSEKKFERIVYYVFDVLHSDGEDLTDQPLSERKKRLEKLIGSLKKSRILMSPYWSGHGLQIYKQSCRLHLEGLISKDAGSVYLPGRSHRWFKTKCSLSQEFVIGGFTESNYSGRGFGSLLMGAYESDGRLAYVGRVGTGFTSQSLAEVRRKLDLLEVPASPFEPGQLRRVGKIHWVKPELVAEIEFRSWTSDHIMRQASFKGLRLDKKPNQIHIEKAKTMKKSANLKITHPERIVYPAAAVSKIEVVNYYKSVSHLILPFLKDRPLSILRCQDTVNGDCYFQKHSQGRNLVGIEEKAVHYREKKDSAIYVASEQDLIALIQAGTVEVHAWGGRFRHITKPDLLVFDLDPETTDLWPQVVKSAHHIRKMLEKLGLVSFVKLTGGKGLHIHVPLHPQHEWDQIKNFSKSLMRVLEDQSPALYTTNSRKAQRKGRIFLDYLRNGYGATAVVPYSLRARERPTVAMPIAWSALKESLSPHAFEMNDVVKLVKKYRDPWKGYWDLNQRIKILANNGTFTLQNRTFASG